MFTFSARHLVHEHTCSGWENSGSEGFLKCVPHNVVRAIFAHASRLVFNSKCALKTKVVKFVRCGRQNESN